MKNVFNSLTNTLFSTIFNEISECIPYLSYLFFVTPPFVTFPSLSGPLSSPKVTTTNFLIFHLITGHCLHQWFPTKAEKTLRGLLKICEDIFGCHDKWDRREGIWWMGTTDPSSPKMLWDITGQQTGSLTVSKDSTGHWVGEKPAYDHLSLGLYYI